MPRDHLSVLPSAGPPWDIVLANLDLASLKNLRQCNRQLAEACIHHRFTYFIDHQTTDLGAQSLNTLSTIAAHPLGRGIKSLTILATVHDTSSVEHILERGEVKEVTRNQNGAILMREYRKMHEHEIDELKEELAWLKNKELEQDEADEDEIAECLRQVLQNMEGAINSIKLEAGVVSRRGEIKSVFYSGKEWRMVWERAARAYRAVMKALISSGVTVPKLTVYQDTPRCAIPLALIAEPVTVARSQAEARRGDCNLKDVKEFALSLGVQTERVRPHAEEPQASVIAGATAIINLMPNLTTLDLQVFKALPTGSAVTPLSSDVFSHLASNVQLPCLKQCRLRGVDSNQQTLMEFITRHPTIQHLELEEIRLFDEDGNPKNSVVGHVVTAIVQALPALDILCLSAIWVDGSLANLYPAELGHRSYDDNEEYYSPAHDDDPEDEENWKGEGFRRGGSYHIHTLRLHGKMLKGDGAFRFRPVPEGRAIGSGALNRWRKRQTALYEPYEWYGIVQRNTFEEYYRIT
ncbi:hypothetical protein V8F20_009033 [Naviculisporaceae sp. PSN 640]